MSPPDDPTKLVALAIIGPLSGVLVGYWLSSASVAKAARRTHRKRLREIKSDIESRQWEAIKCRDLTKDWWVTAVEDYGGIRRWRINRLVRELTDTPFPSLSDNRQDESAYTSDDKKQDAAKTRQFITALESSITKILTWA